MEALKLLNSAKEIFSEEENFRFCIVDYNTSIVLHYTISSGRLEDHCGDYYFRSYYYNELYLTGYSVNVDLMRVKEVPTALHNKIVRFKKRKIASHKVKSF